MFRLFGLLLVGLVLAGCQMNQSVYEKDRLEKQKQLASQSDEIVCQNADATKP